MITVYAKPSNYCTVGCEHCYLSQETRQDKSLITWNKLLEVLFYIKRLAVQKNTQVFWLWHGGEPLLLPELKRDEVVNWYVKAGDLIRDVLGECFLKESMQTSLIHYHSGLKPLIEARFDGGIGTSFDRFRHLKGDYQAYQDLWLKKVNQLRNDGLEIGVSMCPDVQLINYQLVHGITQLFADNQINRINIDRGLNSSGDIAAAFPNNKEHAQILKNLYLAGREFDIDYLAVSAGVRLVRNAYNKLYAPQERWGGTCVSNFITVEPNGYLHACPDISSQTSWSIKDDAAKRVAWQRLKLVKPLKHDCLDCQYYQSCQGGCPITPIDDGSGECSGYKGFLNFIAGELNQTNLPELDEIEVVNV